MFRWPWKHKTPSGNEMPLSPVPTPGRYLRYLRAYPASLNAYAWATTSCSESPKHCQSQISCRFSLSLDFINYQFNSCIVSHGCSHSSLLWLQIHITLSMAQKTLKLNALHEGKWEELNRANVAIKHTHSPFSLLNTANKWSAAGVTAWQLQVKSM